MATQYERLRKLLRQARKRLSKAEADTVAVQGRISALRKKSRRVEETFRERSDQVEELMRQGTKLERLGVKDSDAFEKLKKIAIKKRKEEELARKEKDSLWEQAEKLERTELVAAFDRQQKVQDAVDKVLRLMTD